MDYDDELGNEPSSPQSDAGEVRPNISARTVADNQRSAAFGEVPTDKLAKRRNPALVVFFGAIGGTIVMIMLGLLVSQFSGQNSEPGPQAAASPGAPTDPNAVAAVPVTPPAEVATVSPTPVSGSIGVVSLGQQQIAIRSAFSRARNVAVEDQGIAGTLGRADIRKRIEFAFFTDALSEEDFSKLRFVQDLLIDGRNATGKRPAFQINIYPIPSTLACGVGQIDHMTVAYPPLDENATESQEIPYDYQRSGLGLKTVWDCSMLQAGTTFRYTFHGRRDADSSYDTPTSWELTGFSNLANFQPLVRTTISNAEGSIALWRKSEGVLSIGFYPTPVAPEDISRVRSAHSLTSLRDNPPVIIATMQIPSSTTNLTYDLVRRGYTIELFNNEVAKVLLPEKSVAVHYPAGVTPTTLSGGLRDGSRLIGRLEDSRSQRTNDRLGVYELSWTVTFNAEVVAVD